MEIDTLTFEVLLKRNWILLQLIDLVTFREDKIWIPWHLFSIFPYHFLFVTKYKVEKPESQRRMKKRWNMQIKYDFSWALTIAT